MHDNLQVEYNRYLFLPHIDGRFIPAHPMFLLNSFPTAFTNYPSAVPYLTGFNREDGSEVSHFVQRVVVLLTCSRVAKEHSVSLCVRVRDQQRIVI